MLKRFTLAAAMVAALILSMFVAVPAASAAWTDCPSGQFCFWDGPGGTGNRLTLSYSGSGGQLVCNYLLAWDNRTVSVYNRLGSGRSVLLFDNACAADGHIAPMVTVCSGCTASWTSANFPYRRTSTYLIGVAR